MSTATANLDRWRWPLSALVSLGFVISLIVLMQWLIVAPESPPSTASIVDGVRLVQPSKQQQDSEPPPLAQLTPPPPPAAPPSLARADLPSVSAPAISIAPTSIDVASLGVPVQLGSGLGLGGSGTFGGFARGGGGGTGEGSGYGHGEHFAGRELVPLGTARPQMPDWACKRKISGWIEVVFTVLPSGRVTDVRIVDADPRGVFEAAAIESVSHWIYASSNQTREVEQRVEMDPADCAYNWH
jgi:TonB family protein